MAYSEQQPDWYVANDSDDNYLQNDEHNLEGRYYDDEDEDVDPYYIADTKGRARAFEGKVRTLNFGHIRLLHMGNDRVTHDHHDAF